MDLAYMYQLQPSWGLGFEWILRNGIDEKMNGNMLHSLEAQLLTIELIIGS
jgi:hypothetical protein